MSNNAAQIRIGPGIMRYAPLATAFPTDLVSAWPAGWVNAGYTDSGHEFDVQTDFQKVMVEEELGPVLIVAAGREIHWKFNVAQMTAALLKIAYNGGTQTTAGGVVTVKPPTIGNEVGLMLGWEAIDAKERLVIFSAIQVGQVQIPRKKAPNKAIIACDFEVLETSNGPFMHLLDSATLAA